MSSVAVPIQKCDPPTSLAIGTLLSPDKQLVIFSLALVLFILLLYKPANRLPFINYDDNHYISENPHVRAGLNSITIKWAFTSLEQANWHPLTWISHALDCELFHLNPAGHHFTSVLLHAFNVVVLFILLARSTGRTGPSFIVAALFALHPINVESVAWVAERKNVLSTAFFLLTLGAYGWYALKPGWKRYLAVLTLLACGLMCKPMLVTTPFVLLLLDYWPLRRFRACRDRNSADSKPPLTPTMLFLQKIPLLFLSAISSVITVRAQQAAGAVGTSPFPLGVRLENGVYSYARYLWKAFWPAHLTIFYPYAGHYLSWWKFGAAALFLGSVTAITVKLRSRAYLLVGWLWFLGTLVPVIGVIQVGNQAMADRYAYIPLIGIFVMFAWAAADVANERKFSVSLQILAAICVLAALALATHRQLGYWRSSVDLWTHALSVTQHNYLAEENLGVALAQLNRADEAYPLFVHAAQDQPNDPDARLNIGTYLYQHGHRAEAIEQYELALRLAAEPGLLAEIYTNLGTAHTDCGDYARAQRSFEQAIRLNPDKAGPYQGIAFVLAEQGKLDEAIPYLARSAEVEPNVQTYLQLARALAQTNHRAEAYAAYQQAVRLQPNLIETPHAKR